MVAFPLHVGYLLEFPQLSIHSKFPWSLSSYKLSYFALILKDSYTFLS